MSGAAGCGRIWMYGVLLAHLCGSSSCRHLVLDPLPGKGRSSSGLDAALVIIPETGVKHTEYQLLGRVTQQKFPLRLWVSLLDTGQGQTLTLETLPLVLGESMREMEQAGMDLESNIFLAAHGHSGHLAAGYAQAVPSTLQGLVLFGTFLPKRLNFDSFPLPVLTLVGELDGVVRITRLAQVIQSMIQTKPETRFIIQHPIVVLEGANHDVFVQGELPLAAHALDIEAEVDKQEGLAAVANLTAIFMSRVLEDPQLFLETIDQHFLQEFERAKNLTQPIRSVMQITQNDLKSYWVKAAQKWLSGLEGKQSTQLEVDSYVMPDQAHLPPALVKEHGISYVVTFSDIVRGPPSEDGPNAPEEIAARMMGPERIQEYLENTTISRNYTCRDLNYASFMTAYHTASDKARQRYDSYHRGVIFQPDITTNSQALWENTRLKIETVSRVLHVTSISYQTANDRSLNNFSGLFFCKLLPPDRALEWIYVDSLRRAVSYPDDR